jgi:hypothetical protein
LPAELLGGRTIVDCWRQLDRATIQALVDIDGTQYVALGRGRSNDEQSDRSGTEETVPSRRGRSLVHELA